MPKSVINVVINAKTVGSNQVSNLQVDLTNVQLAAQKTNDSLSRWDTHKIITACGAITSSLNGLASSFDSVSEGYNSFDKAMRSANTMAGKDAAGFEKMKSQVSELGKSIPMTRDALANGLYQAIRSGVPEDNWLSFLEASAKTAVGGMADLGGVVTVTSKIIKDYGLKWDQAMSIQDKIQATAKNGATSFEQLQQALPQVTSNAASLGVSIDDLMASFVTLTGVSGNTAEVASQIGDIFSALITPSREASQMAQEMGIKFDTAAIQTAGSFQKFLKQLKSSVQAYASTSGMLEQEIYSKLFGSAEVMRAIIPLTGELAATYTENVNAMATSNGTVSEAFDQMAQTAESKAQITKNAWAGVTDAIGACASKIKPVVEFGANLGQFVSGSLAAATAIGKLVTTIRNAEIATNSLTIAKGTLRAAIVALPWGIAIAGIGAAVTAFIKMTDTTSKAKAVIKEHREEMKALANTGADIKRSAAESCAAELARAQVLIRIIGDETQSRETRQAALNEAQQKFPEYFGNLTLETSSVGNLSTAYENLSKKILKAAEARAAESKVAELSAKKLEAEDRLEQLQGVDGKGGLIDQARINLANAENSAKSIMDIGCNPLSPQGPATGFATRTSFFTLGANGIVIDAQNTLNGLLAEEAAKRKEIAEINKQLAKYTGKAAQAELDQTIDPTIEPPKNDPPKNDPQSQEKELAAAIDVDEVRSRQLNTLYDYDTALSELRLKSRHVGKEERNQIMETIKAIEEKRKTFAGEDPMTDKQVMEMPEKTFDQLSAKISEIRRLWGGASGEAAQAYLRQIESFEQRLAEMRSKPLLTKEQVMEMPTDTLNNIDAKIRELQRLQGEATGEAIKELQKEIDTLQDLRGEMLKIEKTDIKKKENPFQDFTAVKKMEAGWGAIKGLSGDVETLTAAFDNSATVWERVTSGIEAAFGMFDHIQTIVTLFDSLKDSQLEAGVAATSSAASQVAATESTIPTIKEEANANMEDAAAKAMNAHSWMPFVGIALGAASIAVMLASLFGLPKFANGGIAYGPTLGLFGEYAGARNNPEVVAPLNRLKDLIEPRGGTINGKLKFEIEGRKLVAVYDNEKRRRSRS